MLYCSVRFQISVASGAVVHNTSRASRALRRVRLLHVARHQLTGSHRRQIFRQQTSKCPVLFFFFSFSYLRHQTSGSKLYEELTAMHPYKFATPSQNQDTNGTAFGNLLKRSNFDATANATLTENTPQRRFDGCFSQSLSSSSRHVQPRALGSSTSYPQHIPEIIDNKPSTSGTVSRSIAHFYIFHSFLSGFPAREHLDSVMNQRVCICAWMLFCVPK